MFYRYVVSSFYRFIVSSLSYDYRTKEENLPSQRTPKAFYLGETKYEKDDWGIPSRYLQKLWSKKAYAQSLSGMWILQRETSIDDQKQEQRKSNGRLISMKHDARSLKHLFILKCAFSI